MNQTIKTVPVSAFTAVLSLTAISAPLSAIAAEPTGITRVWTGLGGDALASNPANWTNSLGEAGAPAEGDAVLFDGSASAYPCSWDIPCPIASWTQDGYTGTVTIMTTFPDYSAVFTELNVIGDVNINSGTWNHLLNGNLGEKTTAQRLDAKNERYRLKVVAGGDFNIGTNSVSGLFGRIDVSGLGRNFGPGYSTGDRGGAYGGSGESRPDAAGYGSVKKPEDVGSGAHYGSIPGAGAVYIEAAGNVKIDGLIKANGILGSDNIRCSSGGAVYIKGNTVTGDGLITASGFQDFAHGHGAGGGGRIALIATKQDAAHDDFIRGVETRPSRKSNDQNFWAGGGTMYFEVPSDNRRGILKISNYGQTGYNWGKFTYNYARTPLVAGMQAELDEGYSKIILSDYARLGVDADTLLDLRNTELILDSTCKIFLSGTIRTTTDYEWKDAQVFFIGANGSIETEGTTTVGSGTLFDFQTQSYTFCSNLTVKAGGRIAHRAGAAYFLDLTVPGNLTVETNAFIDATGCGANTSTTTGYPRGYQAGGSFGGLGRDHTIANAYVTDCWGSIYSPETQGANGNAGGTAGGRIRLDVKGATQLDGWISANGGSVSGGAGSGGSVVFSTGSLTGMGAVTANGGYTWNYSAPGGGGRIAVTLTDEDAAFEDFGGAIVALGNRRDSGTSYFTEPMEHKNAGTSRTVRSGAGSVYLRTAEDGVDAGELIFDQKTTLEKSDEYSLSQITATMPDKAFGKITVRGGARLSVGDGAVVTTSVWSNDAAVAFTPSAKVVLTADSIGNAYVYGSTSFSSLEIDDSVRTVYFEAGRTNAFSTAISAAGKDAGARIRFRSTEDGEKFFFDISSSPVTSFNYLDVKDSEGVGGTLSAENSIFENAVNWNEIVIVPGERIYWTGAENAEWGNSANWSLAGGVPAGRTPVRTDRVFINENPARNYPSLPLTDSSFSNLTVAANAELALACGFNLTTGDFQCYGKLSATSSETITFTGGVIWPGTFAPMASTVKITGANVSVDLGGNRFANLEFSGNSRISGEFTATKLTVDAGTELHFATGAHARSTTCYINGEQGRNAVLSCDPSAGAYYFTVTGYAKVDFAAVDHADSSRGITILTGNSTDGGNNVNWQFADNRKVWLGSVNTDFANTSNWLNGEMPGASDGVVVSAQAQREMVISENGAVLESQTILSAGAKFSCPVTITGSAALLGGTLTVDAPLTIGGSLAMLEGSVITHTEQPNGYIERYWCDLTVGGDVYISEGAKVDTVAKGFAAGNGQGRYRNDLVAGNKGGGGSYGGMGHNHAQNADINLYIGWGKCYGSVFWPTNSGSGGSQGGRAGGAFALKACGTVTLNGLIECSGSKTAYADRCGSSGGGVAIKAGKLEGNGSILANAHAATGNTFSGGGGRIALILTDPGADFSAFTPARLECLGTVHSSGSGWGGAGGTIYRQTGNQLDARGTVFIESRRPTVNTYYTYIASACKGTANTTNMLDDLSFATFEFGENAKIRIESNADCGNTARIGDFKLEEGKVPAGASFDLQNNILKVRSKYHRYSLDALLNAGARNESVTKPDYLNIRWGNPCSMLILR